MKKERLHLLLSLLLTLTMLCGCQPVPQNVQQDIVALKEAKEELKKLQESMEYQSVSSLSDLNGQRMVEEHNLLHIDAEIETPDTTKAYLLTLERTPAFWENRYQILEDVGGPALTEEAPYTVDDYEAFMNGSTQQNYMKTAQENANWQREYLGDFQNTSVDVSNDGAMCITNYSVPYIEYIAEKEALYLGETLNELSGDYELLDGSVVTMNDVRRIFDERTEVFETYLSEQEIKLSEMYVMRTDAGRYYLSIRGTTYYKGFPFCRLPTEVEDENDYIHSFHKSGCEYKMWLTSSEAINLSYLIYAFNVISEEKEYKELLSLDSAIDILSANVAMNKITEISEISLEYFLSYPKEQQEFWEYDVTYEARPVWRFTEYDTLPENIDNCIADSREGNIYFVDAVTGEFFAYEDMIF